MSTETTSAHNSEQTSEPAAPASTGEREKHLAAVEQWVLIVCAALILVTLVVARDPRWQLGALAGSLLSLGNARSLRFLGGRLAPRRSVGLLIILFQAKLGIIAALIYLALRFLPVSPLALLLGLSALPLGIILRGLQHGLRKPDAEEDEAPVDAPPPTQTKTQESYQES